ncbi:hypothetical protein J7E90_07970 [Streptomyces sp. ISL-111]|uniref:hypothetical protein n=1 Tax=Streptomyces sp. ISL-111 TaxID=2819175 RepID=UPI001BE676DF|nr:hypothetical protein [Streptomyces sp. ISL-111]MBT2377304.1 hypothetical protein [Streptomyces sp. ISL-111]
MADIENTPETPQEPTGSLVEAPEAGLVPETDSAPEAGSEGPSLDDLRAELEQTATALRTSEDLRQQVHSQVDELEGRVKTAEMALERERAARAHGLPDELMPFLNGESSEELAAQAATLAKYADARVAGLGIGGLDPTDSNSGGAVERIIRRSRAL